MCPLPKKPYDTDACDVCRAFAVDVAWSGRIKFVSEQNVPLELDVIKILHVDDDSDIREIVLFSLNVSQAFELKQYAGPMDALRDAQAFQPDILLLDLMMPGMSGDTLLEHLRVIPGLETTAAIFMTARAQPDDIKRLISAGAKDVIVKPFDVLTLGDQIRAIFERPEDSI